MPIPILKQGDCLIVSIQAELDDADLVTLRSDLADRIGKLRVRGLVIDVSALDVLDSYSTRTLIGIAHASKLRGAETVVVGIQPDVAFAMVQLGLKLEGVGIALDLDDGMALLEEKRRRAPSVR
jgi:rsbT antagonist protein RsbS